MDEINEGGHWGRGIVLFVILLIIIGSCSSGGSDPVQLTDWSGFEQAGGWSPDGSRILISGDPDDVGGNDAFIVDADGSNRVQLTDWPGDEQPGGWSPDGSRVLINSRILISSDQDVNSDQHGQDVFVVDADGSNRVQLTDWPGDEYAGGWSPDGSRILISGNRHSSEWGKVDVYVIRVFSQ